MQNTRLHPGCTGQCLLNFETMKRHILAELNDPEEEHRTIAVPVSRNFEQIGLQRKSAHDPKRKNAVLCLTNV